MTLKDALARSGCTGDPMQDSRPIAAVGLGGSRWFESGTRRQIFVIGRVNEGDPDVGD
jgi:hypothetical protein